MTDQRYPPDIGARLLDHGAAIRSVLAERDLTANVLATIRGHAGSRSGRRPRARRVALLVGAGLVASASTAWAVGTLVFDAGRITVHEGEGPRLPTTADLELGNQITVQQASALDIFLEPDVPWLDTPATAWVDDEVPGQLSLTYAAGPGLPEIGDSGIGMLVQTFAGDGQESIRKYLTTDARATRVDIGDGEAVFLTGGDHLLFYLARDGTYATVPGRLVGNALLAQRGVVVVRVEANLPLARMVELATSLRPAVAG